MNRAKIISTKGSFDLNVIGKQGMRDLRKLVNHEIDRVIISGVSFKYANRGKIDGKVVILAHTGRDEGTIAVSTKTGEVVRNGLITRTKVTAKKKGPKKKAAKKRVKTELEKELEKMDPTFAEIEVGSGSSKPKGLKKEDVADATGSDDEKKRRKREQEEIKRQRAEAERQKKLNKGL